MKFNFSRKTFQQISWLSVMTVMLFFYTNCNQTTTVPSSYKFESPSVPVISGNNVTALSVGCGYVNQLCVSVTICVPGTTSCQTIPNLLLDTGSVGIRVFSSVVSPTITSALASVVNGSSVPYGACAAYGDGTYQWGPLKTADVVMGNMPAVTMPIQLVDFTFGDTGTACKTANSAISKDAASSGYNGIVGIEFFLQDCGASCVTTVQPFYFTCTSSGTITCSEATIPLNKQMTNPISAQATDNNGYYIQLPTVTSMGALNPTGYLVFGIGTQTNNMPGVLKVLTANTSNGHIQTVYSGTTYSLSIIDSGSNGYYFPASLTKCASPLASFYCPGSQANLTAVQKNSAGTVSSTVNFTVTNANQMFDPGNAFSTLAGGTPVNLGGYFDWGLPFFFGRTVWGGVEGRVAANVGTGPYWAY